VDAQVGRSEVKSRRVIAIAGAAVRKRAWGDLSWDVLFGTFRNPKGYEHETGLGQGASARVWDMLLCRDVAVDSADRETPTSAAERFGPRATDAVAGNAGREAVTECAVSAR
jgi:hypothetical protein